MSNPVLKVEVRVSKILPPPLNTSVGIGLFRHVFAGTQVEDKAFTLSAGASISVPAASSVVVHSDTPLTAELTVGEFTVTLNVASMLVLDAPFNLLMLRNLGQTAASVSTLTT